MNKIVVSLLALFLLNTSNVVGQRLKPQKLNISGSVVAIETSPSTSSKLTSVALTQVLYVKVKRVRSGRERSQVVKVLYTYYGSKKALASAVFKEGKLSIFDLKRTPGCDGSISGSYGKTTRTDVIAGDDGTFTYLVPTGDLGVIMKSIPINGILPCYQVTPSGVTAIPHDRKTEPDSLSSNSEGETVPKGANRNGDTIALPERIEIEVKIIAIDILPGNLTYATQKETIIARPIKVLSGSETTKYLKIVIRYHGKESKQINRILKGRGRFLIRATRDVSCDSSLEKMKYAENISLDGGETRKLLRLRDIGGLDGIPDFQVLPCYALKSDGIKRIKEENSVRPAFL